VYYENKLREMFIIEIEIEMICNMRICHSLKNIDYYKFKMHVCVSLKNVDYDTFNKKIHV